MHGKLVIAIDGPAASGKGTLARRLATILSCAYLETGLLYRLLAYRAIEGGITLDDEMGLLPLIPTIAVSDLKDSHLKEDYLGEASSQVAVHPKVRQGLVDFQRNFAAHPPEGMHGAILDGRDIGSVILPDAPFKFYIDAKVEERARRRYKEMQERGLMLSFEEVLHDIKRRDYRDQHRKDAPLQKTKGAHYIDTTHLIIDEAVEKVIAIITDTQSVEGGVET